MPPEKPSRRRSKLFKGNVKSFYLIFCCTDRHQIRSWYKPFFAKCVHIRTVVANVNNNKYCVSSFCVLCDIIILTGALERFELNSRSSSVTERETRRGEAAADSHQVNYYKQHSCSSLFSLLTLYLRWTLTELGFGWGKGGKFIGKLESMEIKLRLMLNVGLLCLRKKWRR